MKLAEALHTATISISRLDAELILGHVLGKNRVQLIQSLDESLTDQQKDNFNQLIHRREACEPVAYLCAQKEFWSQVLQVGPGVLIPRPDTETLIECVCENFFNDSAFTILDVGTGSGNITLAIASEFPQAKIVALDISQEALKYARANVESQGQGGRIELVEADFFDWMGSQAFDLIVSNPPYIPSQLISALDSDICDYEPSQALDGGLDGLSFYRRLAHAAPRLLKPSAWLIVEIGEEQAGAVTEIFTTSGLKVSSVKKDLAGLDRVVVSSLWTK